MAGGRIVILGVFVADASYRAPRLPRLGETLLGSGFALGPGGKGSNQAVAAARLGADVSFITRLGTDAFAAMARTVWSEAGVIPEVREVPESHTGSAFIFLEEGTGENAIIISPGAAAGLGPDDLDEKSGLIASAAIFLTQLEQPLAAARRGLEIARAAGVTTILNPAPAQALPDDLLALCDYLTPNETEAGELSGTRITDAESARAAADILRERGVGTVILTLGARGALHHSGIRSVIVPARPAGPVVETTGAGDAFNSGFATALAEGRDPLAAVDFGCAVAGLSVTRSGAAASMPMRAEVDALSATDRSIPREPRVPG
jgi:ribokinase